jgi:hypothetical protein
MANIPFLLTLFSWLDYSKVGQTFYKSFDKIVTFKDPCGRQGGVVKVAPYSFDCTAHNCIQKTIISSSCKV